jgi:hypothetical protein
MTAYRLELCEEVHPVLKHIGLVQNADDMISEWPLRLHHFLQVP